MVPPQWDYTPKIWQPLFDTIKMSLLGSVIGSVLVVPFAMLASTNIIKNRFVVSFMRLFLSIVRTLPTLVTALIATYVLGLGTMAGTRQLLYLLLLILEKFFMKKLKQWIWELLKPWKPWEPLRYGHLSVP